MRKKPEPPLEYVVWRDAVAVFGPVTADEMPPHGLVATVGIRIREDEESVFLAHEEIEDGRYRQVTAIPKGLIVRRVNLRRVR